MGLFWMQTSKKAKQVSKKVLSKLSKQTNNLHSSQKQQIRVSIHWKTVHTHLVHELCFALVCKLLVSGFPTASTWSFHVTHAVHNRQSHDWDYCTSQVRHHSNSVHLLSGSFHIIIFWWSFWHDKASFVALAEQQDHTQVNIPSITVLLLLLVRIWFVCGTFWFIFHLFRRI